jgi:hypothetical protein
MGKRVFLLGNAAPPPAPRPQTAPETPALVLPGDPVRVAVVNGTAASFSIIEKGRAPIVHAERIEDADLVWDVRNKVALSHGDPIMSEVDGSLLGGVIDRTWAILQTQKLSQSRVMAVRMRDARRPRIPDGLPEEGKSYTSADQPELTVGDVRGRYLTVVNIAADGTVQLLFPTDERDPHIGGDEWTFLPVVRPPYGADHVVAVATSRPAKNLVEWLVAHDGKRDAASLPAVIADVVASDVTRIGTVGLYTVAH